MTTALLVHGIWDSSARLDPLRRGLLARGVDDARAMDLTPNDGSALIPALAAQVAERAEAILRETGAARLDVVGFSMGALVSRWWIQRGGGKRIVRRYVSISGPHAGTAMARAMPMAGVRQMRPGSALLTDLAGDADPWGDVEVHCLYTPYDIMVVPGRSGVLPGAKTVRAVPVAMHRWMITDARCLDAVAAILRAG